MGSIQIVVTHTEALDITYVCTVAVQVFYVANTVIHSIHTSIARQVIQNKLLRGLQRPSVVVWDVPRIACPRLDVPQIFALGHRRSSIDSMPREESPLDLQHHRT